MIIDGKGGCNRHSRRSREPAVTTASNSLSEEEERRVGGSNGRPDSTSGNGDNRTTTDDGSSNVHDRYPDDEQNAEATLKMGHRRPSQTFTAYDDMARLRKRKRKRTAEREGNTLEKGGNKGGASEVLTTSESTATSTVTTDPGGPKRPVTSGGGGNLPGCVDGVGNRRKKPGLRVRCPCCPPSSQKRFAAGRGLRMHFEMIHPDIDDPAPCFDLAEQAAEEEERAVEEGGLGDGTVAQPHDGEESARKHGRRRNSGSSVGRQKPGVPPAPPPLAPGLAAARDGELDMMKRLWEAGEWHAGQMDRHGSMAVHWAAGSGHVNILRWLIEEGGGSDSSDGDAALTVRSFKRKRRDGRQAIHWAARNGRLDALRYLLGRGADPRARAFDGTTPLHLAAYGGFLACCEALLEAATVAAEAQDDGQCVGDQKAEDEVLHEINDWGCSVGHWAAMGGCVQTLAWLGGRGIDFEATQREGHSVLHKAAQRGNGAAVDWLLAGPLADVSARTAAAKPDGGGFTPSDIACVAGHDLVATRLRAAGC